MKHLKQAEKKCSDTVIYRYVIGFILASTDVIKKIFILAVKYSTEIFFTLAIICSTVVTQAFASNAISLKVCILFMTLLLALIVTLIKIKILESKNNRGDKK